MYIYKYIYKYIYGKFLVAESVPVSKKKFVRSQIKIKKYIIEMNFCIQVVILQYMIALFVNHFAQTILG